MDFFTSPPDERVPDNDFYTHWQRYLTLNELKWYCYRILKDQVETDLACIRIEKRAREAFYRLGGINAIDNFRAWIYTIARNEALRGASHLQKYQWQSLTDEAEISSQFSELDTEPTAVPPLLEEAFQRELLSKNEFDVIRYDLSGQFKDRQQLADFLGISRTNCDVIYLRGIRKLVRGIFTKFVRYLGGPETVARIFQHTLQHPPPSFTGREIEAFTEVVLKRNNRYRPQGEALQSACQKMVGIPEIRVNFLY